MNPEEFIPKLPEDLIGKAAQVAKVFCAKIKSGDINPINLLCYGPPGVGKSTVCRLIAELITGNISEVRHISGVRLTVDNVKEWCVDLHYRSDKWQVYWIDEVDSISSAVEIMLLEFMDGIKEKCAFLCTSNEMMSGISGRFQSRMHAIKFEKPTTDEVKKFLKMRWPELGKDAIEEIAMASDGDVRACLNDSQMCLDMEKFGKRSG